jgi:hypothetical protein
MKKFVLFTGGLLLISTFMHSGNTPANLSNSGSAKNSATKKEGQILPAPKSSPILLPLPGSSKQQVNSSAQGEQASPQGGTSSQQNGTGDTTTPTQTAAQAAQQPTCTTNPDGTCTSVTPNSGTNTCPSSQPSPTPSGYDRMNTAC